MSDVTVLRTGLLTTIQDLGRRGLASLAVSRSGAADPRALRLANRLVGNDPGAAGLETTLLGVDLRLRSARWVAVTGAPGPVSVDGRPVALYAPVFVPAGSVLRVGPATAGVRAYVALAGGITVPPVLGSRSTDILSGLGPAPLTPGASLPLGLPRGAPAPVSVAPVPAVPAHTVVRLLPGPRADFFAGTPTGVPYTVSPDSDRVGVRLHGPALERVRTDELPSEAMLPGAVQIPPSGRPVILLADHPTTGGYPVAGVVHPDDLWLVAQARPGTTMTMVLTRRP